MDRNLDTVQVVVVVVQSLSARRAWIEIDWASVITAMTSVALRKESVDRNTVVSAVLLMSSVALRKESVDRNFNAVQVVVVVVHVALRKESVDRNVLFSSLLPFAMVALRKESVDRNRTPHHRNTRPIRRSPQGERG